MGHLKQHGRYCVQCVITVLGGKLCFECVMFLGMKLAFIVYFAAALIDLHYKKLSFMKLINLVIFTQDQKGDPLNVLSRYIFIRTRSIITNRTRL